MRTDRTVQQQSDRVLIYMNLCMIKGDVRWLLGVAIGSQNTISPSGRRLSKCSADRLGSGPSSTLLRWGLGLDERLIGFGVLDMGYGFPCSSFINSISFPPDPILVVPGVACVGTVTGHNPDVELMVAQSWRDVVARSNQRLC